MDPQEAPIDPDLFRQLVEDSPDGLWVIDLQGRTVYANPRIAAMHGISTAELDDLVVFDVLDETGKVQFAEHLQSLRRGTVLGEDAESLFVRRDGTSQWVLVSERLIADPQTGESRVVLRISDFDRRRDERVTLGRARAELIFQLERNSTLQALSSAANDARTLIQILGRGRDLLLQLEDWERAIGFGVDEAGELRRLHPDEADRSQAVADDAADPQRGAMEREVALGSAQSGGQVWNEERSTLAFPIKHQGRVHAVVVVSASAPSARFDLIGQMFEVVADQLERVVARELAEQSLAEARDQAMATSRLKSEFLATVSHEIRTPLNGVLGLNELLLDTGLDAHQFRLAHGIQQSGQVLMSLLNDVLDFSRIESGRLLVEAVDFDIRTKLEQVVEPICETATGKGLDFTIAWADSVPTHVCGDPTRLSQVFANLLANAVKFTPDGAVGVSIDAEPLDDMIRLIVHVTDTGIGIDTAAADVFVPFRQADASTTRNFGGSGLGLAISRELARAMGGDIGYQSQPGRGSVFWFTALVAPHGQGRDRPSPSVTVEAHELAGRRVLVVEDNEVNQLVAAGMLNALGHHAEVAADGLVAVEMMERAASDRAAFDLVLMDIQMPRLDGYAATGRIRAAEGAQQRIPIVAMTANAIDGERERCLRAGMDDFLTKPVSRDDLARVLATWLGGRTGNGPDPEPDVTEVLDLARLDMLREMDPGDTTYLERVLDRFRRSGPEQLAAIRAATSTGDLHFHAHKLVGSASNLGLARVASLASDLELLCAEGDRDTAAPPVGEIVEELASALARGQDALDTYRAGWEREDRT